ncbi:MAG: transglycosylase domain-containing protein [Actinomycetota bacterium]
MPRISPRPRQPVLLSLIAVTALISGACRSIASLEAAMAEPPLAQTSRIYDSRGHLITTLHAEENRRLVSIDRIPESMLDAVVAIEDQRFWTHRGIDLKALMRATYVNLSSGGVREGGSTITQQYVRNAFSFVGRERTIARKLREASLALELEKEHSKEWILEQYLNTIYFGEGAYGIQLASRTFFSKSATALTLPEAALLAGLIAGPERWDPIERPVAATLRRNLVLKRMSELGMITVAEQRAAGAAPLALRPKRGGDIYPAPYFVDFVKHSILTDERFGDDYTQRYNFLFKGGLRIYTTIDLEMQAAAETAVAGVLPQPGDPYGALTAIDPRTGAIKAMVGGRDYFAKLKDDPFSKINLATGGTTGRQAGSAFKPFALVTALENGILPSKTYPAPSSIVLDDPPCGSDSDPWIVQNYEGQSFGGSLTVEQATISSVNVVYAQLIRDLHPERVVEVAHRMGIRSRLRPYCSAVLGANEVSTLEMSSAFGTLAAGGMRHPPFGVSRIEDSAGNILYEASTAGHRAIDPQVAWTATKILGEVIEHGTGTAAGLDRQAAGKTGTAQQWRDAWFVGYIPQLTAAVWVGFPQGQISMVYPRVRIGHVTGGSFPAQIWHAFMTALDDRLPVRQFTPPGAETILVPIDVTFGCVATSSTPEEDIRFIRFVPGTQPTGSCVYPTVAPSPITVVVPDLIGLPLEDASASLEAAGLNAEISYRADAASELDTVLEQYPAPGAEVAPGSLVRLVVSTRD